MKVVEQANFPEFEAEMLKLWDQEKLFQSSLKLRADGKRFRFYDGPPFTSGPPHYGHVEQSTLKDSVARYKTMQGYYVPRRTGADTHGLPIENLVEKEHGFATKKDILAFGIDKFNEACRAVVFRHKQDFDEMYHRLGRWDDPSASYATLDDNYIESVWQVFARLHDKGLVYKGFKSMPYCPRCATPLSNFEVNDGYKDGVPDPSVFVKFPVEGEKNTYLLAWTTTPWSLPANNAIAVAEKADYVTVELVADGDGWKAGEHLILAKERLGELTLRECDYKVVKTQKGQELAGLRYEPLYQLSAKAGGQKDAMYQVYVDESVSLADGTGVLHVASCYGETDLALGQRVGLPIIESVDGNGQMVPEFAKVKGLESIVGLFFKDADPHIIANLEQRGQIFAAETFTHTYPFCWRCETPLLYAAMPSWFVAVSSIREKLVAAAREVKWVPGHVSQGRFIKWLENARDWAVSRTRFWGAPIPVWANVADETDIIVIGSVAELRELTGVGSDFDMHRPGIDELEIKRDGKTYRRVEEVFDCWFESGSMPYAQDHYPFEDKAEFEASFPADFVCEAIEQVHLWFYTLHVLAVALFDKPAYQNVIATGLILGADGRKLSKRLRNYAPPEDIFAEYGADVLRFFILESPLMTAGDTRLSPDALRDVQRNVFMTLWNSYSFLAMYAGDWQPTGNLVAPKSHNVLDAWLLARLAETTAEMTKQADRYEISKAVRPLRELIDDLSNWYVRRSRRRFSRNDDKVDQEAAFATLHYALARISQLLAPWSPFVADKLWRALTKGMDEVRSVHLSDWPEAEMAGKAVLEQMQTVRQIVSEGLAARAAAGIKVRQPLAELTVAGPQKLDSQLVNIVAEEVNVKSVQQEKSEQLTVTLNTKVTQELAREGMARDIIRHIQAARKSAGLSAGDHIRLTLVTPSADVQAAAEAYDTLIIAETLADTFTIELGELGEDVPVKVAGHKLYLQFEKVS